jgi:hypothetical protein
MAAAKKDVFTVLVERYNDALDVKERYDEKYDEVIVVETKDAVGNDCWAVMAV